LPKRFELFQYFRLRFSEYLLRRKELNVGQTTNGLNGFSLGLGVLLDKLQIRYARVYYQNNSAYNQFGLNMKLNKYFGLGKWGKKIGW